MGCHANAGECSDYEKPSRQVRVNGFWLGKTEVTQGQWQKVMGSNPSSFKKGDKYPVEQVSWDDAQQFIAALNSQSAGTALRLPTEAEWEYACRSGGKPIQYAWGNAEPAAAGGKVANLADVSAKRLHAKVTWALSDYDDGYAETAPVASFVPNGLGLFDLSGNVWEWVQDSYDSNAYRTLGTDNPIYQRTGSVRVIRGGSWANLPAMLRCSYRYGDFPGYRLNDTGLRLLRVQ